MCCLTSPAYWNAALMLAARCLVPTSPCCTCRCNLPAALDFISGAESSPTFFQKLEFLCLACCLLASTSSCFSWPGMEIVTRVSVLDLEGSFPLQKC